MKDYHEISMKCPRGSFSYVIKSGDTLYELAKKYNTTVEDILAINPGINPKNLQIGQRICIPEASRHPKKCPMGTFPYTIRQGDTLYNLARTYNTTVEEIMRVNPGIDPNNLQIGQVICIPEKRKPAPDCDGLYYVVRPGDTLYLIANKYNISLSDLMAANPGVDPDNLMVGELICIPKKKEEPIYCPDGTIYEVRENDTLDSILMRFNISYMDLKEGNPHIDIDKLRAGQRICILSHRDRGCPCPRGTRSYTIMPSDIPAHEAVVEHLARKFNTTVSNLMKINPNLSPGCFEEGMVICVPSM